jgi:hypothetical protein
LVLASGFSEAVGKDSSTYGFGEPEIIKLDWSTRSLISTDLNGDGLQDLLVLNNDTSRIELLHQIPEGAAGESGKRSVNRNRWEPVLEDARFERSSITVGFPMFDLSVGDLNGDGRPDLAYTARETPLTIRCQSASGDWLESREYEGFEALGWTHTLQVLDLNGDGADEVVVVATDSIRIYSQDGDQGLAEPEVYFLSGENPFNLMVRDVSGDGLLDLLYLSSDGKQVLAVREQLENGAFGPENREVLDRPARIIHSMSNASGEAAPLIRVDSRSGSLEFLRYRVDASDPTGTALSQVDPEVYPLFSEGRESARFALGDLNGDGAPDLLVANPEESSLMLFEQREGRFQALKAFPTFSSVSSMAAGRFFRGREESVVVLSEAEESLGLSWLDGEGRLVFPRQLIIAEGEPVVCEAMDLDGDGYEELLLVNEVEDGYSLFVAAPSERKKSESDWEILARIELEGVRRQPTALSGLEIFGKGPSGIMVHVAREAPVFLAPGPSGDAFAFTPVAVDSAIRTNLLKGISAAETAVFDVDRDGGNELVVARAGFARAFSFSDGNLEMVDQFNARRGQDAVGAVIPVYDSKGKVETIVLYVPSEGELQRLKLNEDGVYRFESALDVGRIDLQSWYRLSDRSQRAGDAYLLTGADRFWYFGAEVARRSWEVLDTYETDLEDIHYSHVASGDFDGDGHPEIIALDGTENVVDLLARGSDGWASLMFWQVFEKNMHYQGRTGAKLEPRQILIDDLNGDQLLDLAFLVHDRILIYPQQ